MQCMFNHQAPVKLFLTHRRHFKLTMFVFLILFASIHYSLILRYLFDILIVSHETLQLKIVFL